MAKKATLDILDIKVDEIEQEEPQGDAVPEIAKADLSGSLFGRLLTLLGQWCRNWLFWVILAGAALSIAAVLAFLLQAGPAKKTSVVPEKAPPVGAAAPASGQTILLTGFVVDLKDDRGSARVVFCDMALRLERMHKEEAGRGWVESRNLIHAVLKRKKVRELLLADDRNRLKIELKDRLNTLLGENSVKDVYFTRFEIF